jgi:hypothetical protein
VIKFLLLFLVIGSFFDSPVMMPLISTLWLLLVIHSYNYRRLGGDDPRNLLPLEVSEFIWEELRVEVRTIREGDLFRRCAVTTVAEV